MVCELKRVYCLWCSRSYEDENTVELGVRVMKMNAIDNDI